MINIVQDLKYSLRVLTKNPGFTIVALVTIALGVGANTAIFSVVKAVLLNQLPYQQPDRLVMIAESGADAVHPVTVDFTTTYDWRTRSHSFERMSLFRSWSSALVGDGDPELVNGLRVSYDFFDTLGIKMHLGRTFRAEEDKANSWQKLILTHGLWRRRFGGDPNIVGRQVRLNEATFTVVGVLPENFRPLTLGQNDVPREMYAVLGYELGGPSSGRGSQHLRLVARLKPGIAAASARAELNTIMRDIVRENPTSYDSSASVLVTPLQDHVVEGVRTALWVLLGAVGFVLLIACANVMNLLLARATGRSREIALRTALGAGRERIVRQLLTETLVLAIAGGALGVLLAMWGTSLLASLAPQEVPRIAEVKVDLPVLLFGLAASVLAGVLFGLAPSLRASRVDLNDALKEAAKSSAGHGRQGLRKILVPAEMALAFVLVVGAALLGNSFLHLLNVDPGFNPHNVLTLQTYVYGRFYQSGDAELAYYARAFQQMRATPGFESMAMVSTLPLGGSFDRSSVHVQDRPLHNPADAQSADRYSISPDYFHVMRIPVKRGRVFTDQDRQGAPPVMVVSESFARALFPDRDPIGKHIQVGSRNDSKPWATIVGVVGDVRQYGIDRAPIMAVYKPQAQDLNFTYQMVARTTFDPRRLASAARQAFLAADKTQPIFDVLPMDDYLSASLAERSFTLILLALFGVLALTLAGVGIYGVISYAVSLRTREFGIRMALGARQRDVLAMVLRQGATLTITGLVVGLIASLALTRFLSTLLFEVRSWDPATSAIVAVVLALVALVACYIPARRATKVDPMVALRYE
ncbi:MAG TPA: ABC transporter permease [Bryobacteraceae bacterium]|nr:ABC transporter permease [Bryobacteraceae bacterium]